MNTQKVFGLTLLTLALTACGSGSGGGDGQPPLPQNTEGKTVEGLVSNLLGWGTKNSISGKDINKLTINGKDIDLMPSGMSRQGEWLSDSENGRSSRIISAFLSNARIGVLSDRGQIHIFAQGYATPQANIPDQGTVRYIGEHILLSKNKEPFSSVRYNSWKGAIGLEMNFADKAMKGVIELPASVSSSGTSGYMPFRGEINGNEVYTVGDNNPISLTGKFYGENADEVAGIYSHIERMNLDKAFSGAFGAKKEN